ncbi:MAG: shikimate dehydrogenase, partial [Rhodospirillaceae bacterium]|nr:shikimate dehydrogenase [Rhodospirillaceae bacterium]
GAALRALPALGLRGVNLTLPHKETALRHVDTVDAMGRRIGAINTVVVTEDGALAGSNTDGYGFIENLRAGAPGWDAAAGSAVLLGAGGAARGVCAALLDAGVSEIRIVNRTRERAEALAAEFGSACAAIPWAERSEALAAGALLVNTTSLGMVGQPPLDLALDDLPPEAIVNDIVYVPLETPLLAAARARGNAVVDGLGMLLHQGRPGFAAWFGVEPEVTSSLHGEIAAEIAAEMGA